MFDYYSILENIPYLVTILGAINILIALAIIFLERKNPSATLAWIMILFLLPVVGIILYILLSQNISRKKIFRLTKYEEESIRDALANQIKEIDDREFVFSTDEAKRWKDMMSALRLIGYDGAVSIEHEDGLMSPREGLEKAIEFLKMLLIREQPAAMWWS